ncbi:unnamed protein product [Ectocarpus sp. 4 AP-2014]
MLDPLSIMVGCGIIIFWALRGTQRRRWIRSRRRKQRNMRRGAWVKSPDYCCVHTFSDQSASCVPLRTTVQLYRSVSYVAAGTDCIEKSVIGYYYYRKKCACHRTNDLLSLLSLSLLVCVSGESRWTKIDWPCST